MYLEPLLASPQRVADLERFLVSRDAGHMTRIRPALEKLDVPALVAWGQGDGDDGEARADRLARTIPGVRRVEKTRARSSSSRRSAPSRPAR